MMIKRVTEWCCWIGGVRIVVIVVGCVGCSCSGISGSVELLIVMKG